MAKDNDRAMDGTGAAICPVNETGGRCRDDDRAMDGTCVAPVPGAVSQGLASSIAAALSSAKAGIGSFVSRLR